MSFFLGEKDEYAEKDLRQRLTDFQDHPEDVGLNALLFQYGRYLLIAASRPGTQAANLQGIWNAEFMPMWDSKYTININLQMNYWLSWTGNLTRLHEPVLDLLETMHEPGKKTAEVMYGMRGMVCHHNTDYYGDCAPQDVYMASTPWVMGVSGFSCFSSRFFSGTVLISCTAASTIMPRTHRGA